VNSTQSPSAAVRVSGVNVRPGPTFTAWMSEADEEAPEAVAVIDDELSSPY
jgi:hypothetical protein